MYFLIVTYAQISIVSNVKSTILWLVVLLQLPDYITTKKTIIIIKKNVTSNLVQNISLSIYVIVGGETVSPGWDDGWPSKNLL